MFTVIGVLVATAFVVILRGWVLTQLWAWFVTPTLGLPALGVAAAIGLSLIVGHFSGSGSSESDPDFGKILLKGIFQAVFFLFFGWIWSGVM